MGSGTLLTSSSRLVPRLHIKKEGIVSFNPLNIPLRPYSYSHFTEEDMEAWRGQVTCPRSYSWEQRSPDWTPEPECLPSSAPVRQ